MKINRGFLTLVIVAIVLYLIIMVLLFYRNNSYNWNEERTDYLMIGYNELWRIKDSNFTHIEEEEYDSIFEKRTFNIYQNTNYIGYYQLLQADNGMYQYRNNQKFLIDIYPTLIAYSSINNTEFRVMDDVKYTMTSDEDKNFLESYIPSEAKTPYIFNELTLDYKLVYDFDKDGMNETVYTLSSLFNNEYSDSEYVFQLLLYVDDSGSVQELVNQVVPRISQYDAYQYEFLAVFQFSNSEKYSIVFNGYRPMGGMNDCPILMSLDGFNSFRIVKACQEVENS